MVTFRRQFRESRHWPIPDVEDPESSTELAQPRAHQSLHELLVCQPSPFAESGEIFREMVIEVPNSSSLNWRGLLIARFSHAPQVCPESLGLARRGEAPVELLRGRAEDRLVHERGKRNGERQLPIREGLRTLSPSPRATQTNSELNRERRAERSSSTKVA